MKPKLSPFALFTAIIFLAVMTRCNSGRHNDNTPDKDTAGTGVIPERTAVAVFAVWSPDANTHHDGMFDSATNYMSLCQTNELVQIKDLSQLVFSAESKCYRQTMRVEMITVTGESGKPVFLTVLDVDSVGQKLVGLTARNDTIIISTTTLPTAALEKLRNTYRKTALRPAEIYKIKEYYRPESQKRNEARKEEILQMKARRRDQ